MDLKRVARHLVMTRRRVDLAFPGRTLAAIGQAIKASEAEHAGEIRFAVEGALDIRPLLKGQSTRERAIDVFSEMRIWDTEYNNGVLIYMSLADRTVEIVVDRGIHAKVGSKEWERICGRMETDFQKADFEGGVVRGVQAVTQHLIKHFPLIGDDGNELPDKPVVL
jgi:uncharacterized membrane protein